MPVFNVKVKWQKETFNDLQLNSDEDPLVFKAQLMALTGVQVDRQKVMLKGKVIGDTWDGILIKDGITIMMIGTVDELPKEPLIKTEFIEDMDEKELSEALNLPAGLSNLGNTCYLNATVQCLKTVPELRDAIGRASPTPSQSEMSLVASLRDLYKEMDSNAVVLPLNFTNVFHLNHPLLAAKNENGGFVQQDASECWIALMKSLQSELKPLGIKQNETVKMYNVIEQYFEGTFDVVYKNIESDEEEEVRSTEKFLHLSCFISNHDVKYLLSGLRSKLEENITKFSNALQKDCTYLKKNKLSRLPAYLTIQIIRFELKGKGTKYAKILKCIKYSTNLDVYELCSSELQDKLLPMREKFRLAEQKEVDESHNPDNLTGGDRKPDPNKLYSHPFSFADDPGSNNSGFYELQAVLTHRGRNVSSGHYVAWIRRDNGLWYKCDDESVDNVTIDEILNLSGGGDWHCTYLLLYGPRILKTTEKPDEPMEIEPAK